MKKIIKVLLIFAIGFTSCEGPQGPAGPPGEDGLLGTVIDIEGDFTTQNDFSILVEFNDFNVEVFESDVVLVYLKIGEDGTANGAPVEVFRMLPQTFFVDGEQLQYNFDYTFFDVLVFLDGTVDFSSLDPSFTDNQVLRIAIVPAAFAETSGVDLSNINAVMNALDVKESDIEVMSVQH